ncbi:MAG: sigma 54-interacting transcriptional regulator, partial [Syntrophomonas sp.]
SAELRNVKELNDAIVESSYDGLVVTDCKGSILRYNKAFERLAGIDSHEYLGRSVEDIREDKIISDPVTTHVLEEKKSITIMQESKLGKHLLTTGTPIFDEQGEITRVVCNTRDITELNLLRQKLEKVKNLTQHYESQIRTLKMQYTGNEKMVITSGKMKDLIDMVIRVAAFEATVLITGESGTGKELIAEIIHANSLRNNKPFIKVNCGAIPENLLESELFGYEGGAFTGAKKQGKSGYIEMAEGGTLFLDEIAELPLNLQVKLLRFLQNKEIIRVGGESFKKIDVRIVAATNRDLSEMVENKQFRDDLYYRLNVVPVNITPLRNRKEDIPALVAHFLQIFNRKYKMHKRIAPGVINIFMQYDWPGNVRELENLIERLVVITLNKIINIEDLPPHMSDIREDLAPQTRDTIEDLPPQTGDTIENLSPQTRDTSDVSSPYIKVSGIIPLKVAIESVEKQLLEKVYAKNGTTREIAEELKVDASTIVRKAAKYNIAQIKSGKAIVK